MKQVLTITRDSYDQKELKGDFHSFKLTVDGSYWELDLSEENYMKLLKAIDPFIMNEAEKELTFPERKRADGSSNPTAEERAAIAQFVETEGIGTVGKVGRVRAEFIRQWEAAGKPFME